MAIYDRALDRVCSLNATGAAPMAIDSSDVTPHELVRGIRAGVVPGLFGGWIVLLDRFGTRNLSDGLEPAIEYAEEGRPLDRHVATSIARQRSLFERFPSSARVFLPNGRPPEAGEMLKYPDLANTFKRVLEAEREQTPTARRPMSCYITNTESHGSLVNIKREKT